MHAALLWGDPGSDLELRDTVVAARLFDAAGRAGVARTLYVSSVSVHRPFSGDRSEDDSLAPTDLYGAIKAAAELFLRSACATHGMTGVAIRPGPVVGPPAFAGAGHRTDQRLAAMVAAATFARPIEVLEGDARQWSDVTAMAEVIRLLIEIDDPLKAYLRVDREVLAWEWIAKRVVACLDSGSEVRVLPHEADVPTPRFRTHRVEELLGKPMDARDALLAHIHHLARASQ